MKQFLLMIALVALVGCETSRATRMAELHEVFDPIIGLSHTQMVNRMGPPTSNDRLDDGTSVATYHTTVTLFDAGHGNVYVTVFIFFDKNRIATRWAQRGVED